MKFLLKTEIKDEKYTWLQKFKYTFYITLLSIALLVLYSFTLEFYITSSVSKNSFLSLFKENFHLTNFYNTIFPHIIFYMLFEELAFRKSLVISVKNLAISLPLILYLSFKSFLDESFHLFIYSFYALFIIIIFKREYSSKFMQRIHTLVSLLALTVFHLSKFSTDKTDSFELIFSNLIPFFLIGVTLAHVRMKFDSPWSIFSYFLIVLVANIL